jgi:hypothetical protein
MSNDGSNLGGRELSSRLRDWTEPGLDASIERGAGYCNGINSSFDNDYSAAGLHRPAQGPVEVH